MIAPMPRQGRCPALPLLLLCSTFAACGNQAAPATPTPLPTPPLTAAAKERIAAHADPSTWEDLDAEHPGRRRRDPRTGIVFVRVPAGEFTMGSDDGAADRPAHRVRLSQDYLLAETELTIGQWQRHLREFAGDPNPPVPAQPEQHPMPLSCSDALDFCARYGYRLPTEAEWERACTADLPRDQEPWRTEAGMRAHAWFHRNAEMKTHPVGTLAANGFGLHDMLGNLWEWCGEDWNPVAYAGRGPLTTDPHGAATTFDHVLRGGSWFSVPPASPRTRLSGGFAERSAFFGCRPARSLPPK